MDTIQSRLFRWSLRAEELLSTRHARRVLLAVLLIVVACIYVLTMHFVTLRRSIKGATTRTHCINTYVHPAYSADQIATLGDFAPDGHTTILRIGDEKRTFISVGVETKLIRELVQGAPQIQTVFAPSGVFGAYDRDYAGITSIVQTTDNPLILYGFYHAELRSDPYNPTQYQASIGLASSTDGGLTWERVKKVLGSTRSFDATRITGVGQPSAVVMTKGTRSYVYLYYVDWDAGEDAIHMARAPIGPDGSIGEFASYANGRFVPPRKNRQSTPVVVPVEHQVYAALPNVATITNSHELLMAYEAADGFYVTSSVDGISWRQADKFYCFKEPDHMRRFKGEGEYESYPTLVNPITQLTDTVDPYRLQLLFGQGRPHHPVMTTVDVGALYGKSE